MVVRRLVSATAVAVLGASLVAGVAAAANAAPVSAQLATCSKLILDVRNVMAGVGHPASATDYRTVDREARQLLASGWKGPTADAFANMVLQMERTCG